jgi:hypothetical protein
MHLQGNRGKVKEAERLRHSDLCMRSQVHRGLRDDGRRTSKERVCVAEEGVDWVC